MLICIKTIWFASCCKAQIITEAVTVNFPLKTDFLIAFVLKNKTVFENEKTPR